MAMIATIGMPSTMYQNSTKKSEIPMTIIVGAGSSAPKPEKTLLNSGITNSIITEITSAATTMTAIG